MNSVNRDSRNVLIEPGGARSYKVTMVKMSEADFILCLWTNIVK